MKFHSGVESNDSCGDARCERMSFVPLQSTHQMTSQIFLLIKQNVKAMPIVLGKSTCVM